MTRLMGKTYSKAVSARATTPVALALSSLLLTPMKLFSKLGRLSLPCPILRTGST